MICPKCHTQYNDTAFDNCPFCGNSTKTKKIKNALIDSRHIISPVDKKLLKERLNDITDSVLLDYLSKRVIALTPCEILELSKKVNPLFGVNHD